MVLPSTLHPDLARGLVVGHSAEGEAKQFAVGPVPEQVRWGAGVQARHLMRFAVLLADVDGSTAVAAVLDVAEVEAGAQDDEEQRLGGQDPAGAGVAHRLESRQPAIDDTWFEVPHQAPASCLDGLGAPVYNCN